MNHTTLGLVAVFVAAALVVGSLAATTTPAFAGGKDKSSVKVGSTKNKCVTAADNGQHAAFGPGSILDIPIHDPINLQAQFCNVGSTGAG